MSPSERKRVVEQNTLALMGWRPTRHGLEFALVNDSHDISLHIAQDQRNCYEVRLERGFHQAVSWSRMPAFSFYMLRAHVLRETL